MTGSPGGSSETAAELRKPSLALGAVYVASLPLLWPSLLWMPGIGKSLVVSDLLFAAFVVSVLALDRRQLTAPRWDALLACALPVAMLVLSAWHNGVLEGALADVLRVGYSLVVLLFLCHLRLNETALGQLSRAWVLGACLICGSGLVAYVGVVALGWPESVLAYADSDILVGVVRLRSTLGPNALPLYVAPSLALTLFLVGHGPPEVPPRRRALGSAVVVMLAAAALTFSRSVAGLLVSLALIARQGAERLSSLWKLRGLLAATAIVVLLGAGVTMIWAVVPVAGSGWRFGLNRNRAEYSVLHAAAFRMLSARPLVGFGPGEYGRRLWEFTSAEERDSVSPWFGDALEAGLAPDPHSTWLGWAAETGLLGLGSWLLLYGWMLRQLLATGARQDALSLRRLAALTLVGILLNGFHVEISHLKFLWAFLGLALSTPPPAAEGEGGPP